MALLDLLDAGLLQTFNFVKTVIIFKEQGSEA